MPEVRLRTALPDDEGFLVDMTLAAVNWDRPLLTRADVLALNELNHYAVGWGRAGDLGVIAESESDDGATTPVGAAWVRLFHPEYPGYGFVSGGVPELSMAVRGEYRGSGIGTRLMEALLADLRAAGSAAVSLSVARANRAVRLYERTGFVVVEDSPGTTRHSLTMMLTLRDR
jgi:ribosomal protein S18 acetylase RimI-like enzyme